MTMNFVPSQGKLQRLLMNILAVSVREGQAGSGQARLGRARPGLARLAQARLGQAKLGQPQPGQAMLGAGLWQGRGQGWDPPDLRSAAIQN